MNLSKLLISLYLGLLVNIGITFADGHSRGPTLQHIGEIKFDLIATSMTEGTRITGTFGNGTISFADGGGGVLEMCVEDGYVKANGTIDFTLWCHVTLDDGKTLMIKYAGIIVGEGNMYDRLSALDVLGPGNGMDVWWNEMKMLTGSEKYAWLNDTMIVGEGVALQMPDGNQPGIVHYKMYKLVHSN